jgi:hypothetical protein
VWQNLVQTLLETVTLGQMHKPVDTRIPSEVETQVQAVYRDMYPAGNRKFVGRAFRWVEQCFVGKYRDYQAIDARYHDLEHTLQGTLCLARLLHGRHRAGAEPVLSQQMFELGLLAMLFHDTGYLKKEDDKEGTGAKYTLVHVGRSASFAAEFLRNQGYREPALLAVQNMIRCTGVDADLKSIPFQDEIERMIGYALGTADLLGQMAAPDYVEKLEVLFLEFAEAVHFSGASNNRLAQYQNAADLRRNTPLFYRTFVLPRIEEDFGGLCRYLNDPYPSGPNPYLQRIEQNIAWLKEGIVGA